MSDSYSRPARLPCLSSSHAGSIFRLSPVATSRSRLATQVQGMRNAGVIAAHVADYFERYPRYQYVDSTANDRVLAVTHAGQAPAAEGRPAAG